MARVLLFVLMLLVPAAAPRATAAPVPKGANKKPFFPTAVGAKWVYRQDGTREWTEEVVAAERAGGTTTLTVRHTEEAMTHDATYAVTAEGVTWVASGRSRLGHVLLQFPAKAGDEWTVTTPSQPGLVCEGGDCSVRAAEDVDVTGGKFRAFPVVFVAATRDGRPLPKAGPTYTRWYAEGVGLVKFHCDKPSTFRELKFFTPGK